MLSARRRTGSAPAKRREPDSVILADSTRRLLGNLFELQHVKSRRLKGVTQPVLAWLSIEQIPWRTASKRCVRQF